MTHVNKVMALFGTVLIRFTNSPRYMPLHPFSSNTNFDVSIRARIDSGCILFSLGGLEGDCCVDDVVADGIDLEVAVAVAELDEATNRTITSTIRIATATMKMKLDAIILTCVIDL